MSNLEHQVVYTVDRNSPSDCEQGTTIALFSSCLNAKKYARKLNKEQGWNIVLDDEGDMDKIMNEDDYVYFDTGAFTIDDNLDDLYKETDGG